MKAQPTMTPEQLAEWEQAAREGTLFGVIDAPRHGTLTAYTQGCRCDDCRRANRDYYRDWYARNRERMNAYQRARYHARKAQNNAPA